MVRWLLPITLMVLLPQMAQAQNWSTESGGPRRDRSTGPLESTELEPVWSIESFGPPASLWVGDLDGDPQSELLAFWSGRAGAANAAGMEWLSVPSQLAGVWGTVDLDGDARPEVLTRNSQTGFSILSGVDGQLLFQSSIEDLALTTQRLVRDLDGDGTDDFLFAEIDCGSVSRGIGRAIAYSLVDPSTPTELFRLQESSRDYNCGRGMALADLDGTGAVSVIAAGNHYLYRYSTQDGALLERSEDLGPFPYGQVDISSADVDGDGADELLFVAPTYYPSVNNARRVFLVGRDADGVWGLRWEAAVPIPALDLVFAPAEPLVDLNGDGIFEVVHSFWDSTASDWTTFVRDARDGAVLTSVPGRIAGLASHTDGFVRVFIADLASDTMARYRFQGGLLELEGLNSGDTLVTRMSGESLPTGYTRQVPLLDWVAQAVVTADRLDANGVANAQVRFRLETLAGVELAHLEVESGEGFAVGADLNGNWVFAHARLDGWVGLYDAQLALINGPTPEDTTLRTPGQNKAAVIAGAIATPPTILAGRGRDLYDASMANLATQATATRGELEMLGLLDGDGDGSLEWLGFDGEYSPTVPDLVLFRPNGSVLWNRDGLVTTNPPTGYLFHKPNLGFDLDGDGIQDILMQRADNVLNSLPLTPLSGATGAELWSSPVSATFFANSSAHPLHLLTDDGGRLAYLRAGVVQLYSVDGQPVGVPNLGYLGLAADVNADGEDEVVTTAAVGPRWTAINKDGQQLWKQDTLPAARWAGVGASFVSSPSARYVVEGRQTLLPYDHNLVILDATTGALLHRLNLSGGEVLGAQVGVTATNSLGAGVGFNGEPPLFMVGGADGTLYLLDLSADLADPAYPANLLVATWSVGAAIGDLSAADINNDGFSEIFVPNLDGAVVVMEPPALDTIITVADTNCADPLDVDVVERTDVFCAAWTMTGEVPDGYVVTLLDVETGARMADRMATVTSAVRFEGIRLTLGRTYAVEVQGYSGAGPTAKASRRYSSDGAVVVDPMQPPAIQLSAAPLSFVPCSENTVITAELDDPSPLSSYRFTVEGSVGVVLDEGELLNTSHHTLTETWTGCDANGVALPLGDYVVTVTADDFSGLSSTASLVVTLVERVSPEVELLEEVESLELELELEAVDQFEVDTLEAEVEPFEVDTIEVETFEVDTGHEVDAAVEDQAEGEDAQVDTAQSVELELAEEWVWACGCRVSGPTRSNSLWPFALIGVFLAGWVVARRSRLR